MKVKVIKEFKGLEVGDVLYFNEKEYRYELTKVNEDISETSTSTTKKFYAFSDWTIKNNKEYFEFIDDTGIKVDVIETVHDSEVQVDTVGCAVDAYNKQIQELTDKVKELETKNEVLHCDVVRAVLEVTKYKHLVNSYQNQFKPRFWLF